jgi:subtilisin family serine protease
VRAVEAWNAGVTGAGVRVCVLDTGYDMDHPDLIDNINQELSIDCTTNFYGACSGRPNFKQFGTISSHGTHVAGTIAAAKSKSTLGLQLTGINISVSPTLNSPHKKLLILLVTPTSDNYGMIGVAYDAELVL